MLHLARKAFYPGTLPSVAACRYRLEIREMYEFRDRAAKAYGCGCW